MIILISGCQRSGTTLLSLILDSHPNIHSVDEMDYKEDSNYSDSKNAIALKLPTKSHRINEFEADYILWCSRNSYDTVTSMIRLEITVKDETAVWAIHSKGALREIENCSIYLRKHGLLSAKEEDLISACSQKTDSAIHNAAVCILLKRKLCSFYSKKSNFLEVRYEELITNPEKYLKNICTFLGISFSKLMLKHHELHNGTSVGKTRNDRPIDPTNINTWKKTLKKEHIDIIDKIIS